MTDPAPPPTARHLWATLRYFIEHACYAVGMPLALARKLWVDRIERAHILAWLAPLEAMLRRLVLAEAAAYAGAAAPHGEIREAKARLRKPMRARSGARFNLDDSDSWSVSFNLALARGVSPRASQREGVHPPANVFAAAPLALRLEALIRGFNAPEPLARRLARLLQRAPARVSPLRRAPARLRATPLEPSVLEAAELAAAATQAWRSDSS